MAGVTDDQLCTAAFQKLFHGIYVCSTVVVTPAVRAAGALQAVGAGSYASHHTAGLIWGIPVPVHGVIHVTAPDDQGRNRRRGVVTHRPSRAAAVTIKDGVRLSTPSQVFCDLASYGVGLVDLVVVGDGILRARLATREELARAVARMSGAGARSARRALGYLRDGVDSAMESRLRMLLVLAGFPEPEVNLMLRGADGSWRRRFDLAYRDLKLLIEYDGRQHADNPQQWESDIFRREELQRLGYVLVTVTAGGIYSDPGRTLRRVADAVAAAGGSVPRRWKPEWQAHFPGREDRA